MSASPSTSPPHTPDDNRGLAAKSRQASTTPNSDDSSIIDDLSFEYVMQDGAVIRLSKGSGSKSTHSSPPTPLDKPLEGDAPHHLKPPSPSLLDSPMGRISLSRSESAFPILGSVTASSSSAVPSERPVRSFQRVGSGPVVSMTPSYAAPTSSSTKARLISRRMEDNRDPHERVLSSTRARQTLDSQMPATLQEEKENISESDENPYAQPLPSKQRHSPPLNSRSISSRALPLRTAYSVGSAAISSSRSSVDSSALQRNALSRQVLPNTNRPGRIIKSASSSSKYNPIPGKIGFERISEVDNNENDHSAQDDAYLSSKNVAEGEDTDIEDEHVGGIEPASIPLPSSIPSASYAGSSRQRSQTGVTGELGSSINPLSVSGNTRPRRSASLSDALARDDYQLQVQQAYQATSSRPGTSLGMNALGDHTGGPRRVTTQEKYKLDSEIQSEYIKYRQEAEEIDRREQGAAPQQTRQSPSPTRQQIHVIEQSQRPVYGHRRRDSDTLRTVAPPLSAPPLGSPTVMELPPSRISPRLQSRASPPSISALPSKGRISPPSSKGRISPPIQRGRISPPTAKGRLSPPSSREVVKHRRSPTAPEPPTTSAAMGGVNVGGFGRTWASGEREESDLASASERDREGRGHQSHAPADQQPQLQQLPQAQRQAPSYGPPLNRHFSVNKKPYARLDLIGKGGSSRVFRVLSQANELYAIKRVSLDSIDSDTMNGYMNEIALLKRLDGNNRIIRLIDSEVRAGTGGSKGHLLLVMECGEVDLSRLLQEQQKEPLNMVWVAYYWQQMLQAVHVIHEEKIVHSDLKPANFVLVRGQLKLIDFGIANAIANDTTNIQRDHQVGTVNYMSPEAIELPDGMRRLKVGRPSDVWSLGCILYQMVYGNPPFYSLSMYHKMKAIPDNSYNIDFLEYSVPSMPAPRTSSGSSGVPEPPKRLDHLKRRVRPDVIASMKSCLVRGPKERVTIPELLDDGWLAMKEPDPPAVKELLAADETVINPYFMRQLLQYGIKLGENQAGGMDPETLLREAERLVVELKSVQP